MTASDTTSTAKYETVGIDATDVSSFGCFEMDGGVVVYENGGDGAWIRANASVPLSEAA